MADEKKKATKAKAKKAESAKAPAKKAAAKKETAAKAPAKKAAKKETGKAKAEKAPAKAAPKKEQAKKPAAKPVPIVVRASSRYVRIAPRKARLIADQVRGLHIEKARALLQFSPRSAAHDIKKLIESAASNAENNHDLVADEMLVAEITVDEGPTLRRFRPRAQGRATRINKRTSHIGVALSPEEDD
jgi:large subunit ribosomal protein L22